MGGWIEQGDGTKTSVAPLHAFQADGNGLAEYVLKNLYVYFWRWGTWKVFDHQHDASGGNAGIVCFISTSGYLRGPGFKGMREYLRRTCSEGWIIDLTPEGQTPDVPTQVFPGVRQPLAIGLFRPRAGGVEHATGNDPLPGRARSADGQVRGPGEHRSGRRILARGADRRAGVWDEFPALIDVLPWAAPGVKANRTWVYSPSRATLARRWLRVVAETDPEQKRLLFKESRDA